MRTLDLIASACLVLGAPLTAQEGAAQIEEVTLSSEHFTIHSEGPQDEAAEWLDLLEQSYADLTAFFGEAPTLAEGEKLEVYFAESQARMHQLLAELENDREFMSGNGFCMIESRRIFLRRGLSRAKTRGTLLHEAVHQFQYALHKARVKPRQDPGAVGLNEGLAHTMETHTWVDRELERSWPHDYLTHPYLFAQIESVRMGSFSPSRVFEGQYLTRNVSARGAVDRAKAHLLVRYFIEGCDEKTRTTLLGYLRKLDQGLYFDEDEFWKRMGAWRTHAPRFKEWVEAMAPEWGCIWGEFTREDGGFSGGGEGLGAIRTGLPVRGLSATAKLLPGERGDVGVLLQYRHNTWCTYARVDPEGRYRVFAYDGKRSEDLASGQAKRRSDGEWKFEVSHSKAGITVNLNGVTLHTIQGVAAAPMGLATGNARALFSEVKLRSE